MWDFKRKEEEFKGRQEILGKSWQENVIQVRNFKKNRGRALEFSRNMFRSFVYYVLKFAFLCPSSSQQLTMSQQSTIESQQSTIASQTTPDRTSKTQQQTVVSLTIHFWNKAFKPQSSKSQQSTASLLVVNYWPLVPQTNLLLLL